MARKRQADLAIGPLHRTLSAPAIYLVRMFVFLSLVILLAAILVMQKDSNLLASFKTNPLLNGLILGVLGFGILFAFRQVTRLYPEIKWVNAFRISDPGLGNDFNPVLLAPMATMLRERTGALSLSTNSMRTIMDSIGTRLDEARDTGRYLVGLLVFLGLLGTFWGLLETIQSVGKAISTLDTKATESAVMFDELKAGLMGPLKGMGTAFSASLLGLSGSLVLGFMELQASHAHNRFYNELEEWLSGITELTPAGGSTGGGDQLNRQVYGTLFEVQRGIAQISDQLNSGGGQSGGIGGSEEAVRELVTGLNQMIAQMRAEQNILRKWADDQAQQSHEVALTMNELANRVGVKR
jgi:hypothetical protein